MNSLRNTFVNFAKKSLGVTCLGLLLTTASNLEARRHNSSSCSQPKKPIKNKCAQKCACNVLYLINTDPTYMTLYQTLNPQVPELTTLLQNLLDVSGTPQDFENAYDLLYAACEALASTLPTGRVVVTDSDGLVVVDTGKPNGTGCNGTFTGVNACLPNENNYPSYNAGGAPATFYETINVNHNSRVAILDAQQYVCGIGAETKYSNSVHAEQNYVAIRLGPYLNSTGTARISVNAGSL